MLVCNSLFHKLQTQCGKFFLAARADPLFKEGGAHRVFRTDGWILDRSFALKRKQERI